MRVYVPATMSSLRSLSEDGELKPVGGTAFALTPAFRESFHSGDTEELEYAAMREAARASLRLVATELAAEEQADGKRAPRRAVIAADVDDYELRPDLDFAVVRLPGVVPYSAVAAVHVDDPEAADAVRAAAGVIDAADLGDPDAEFTLGDAEDHELSWYAPQEVPFLFELDDL